MDRWGVRGSDGESEKRELPSTYRLSRLLTCCINTQLSCRLLPNNLTLLNVLFLPQICQSLFDSFVINFGPGFMTARRGILLVADGRRGRLHAAGGRCGVPPAASKMDGFCGRAIVQMACDGSRVCRPACGYRPSQPFRLLVDLISAGCGEWIA